MTVPTFEQQVQAWSSPPLDGIGYLPAADLLELSDDRLRSLIETVASNRYGGWRNWQGNWRRVLGLDTTSGKRVLDYGCGCGVEALQYARAGNEVWVADIAWDNVSVAERVLGLHGYEAHGIRLGAPLGTPVPRFDVIHCAGVLHHIPDPSSTVEAFAAMLADDGELRLMVYSDEAWEIATGSEPPDTVEGHPDFERYWTTWDPIGGYADWYDRQRLEQRFGKWFTVRDCEYLTERGEYLGAVLVKR